MGLVLVSCVMACQASEKKSFASKNESTYKLEYNFQAGDKIDMNVRHRSLTETTIGDTRQSTETSTDSLKTWRVMHVDRAGLVTLEQSVDKVTMTSRTTDRGEIRWSSSDNGPPPPGYEKVSKSLGVPLTRLIVDRTGRIIQRQDLQSIPQGNTGDLVVVPLPDNQVSEGESWVVADELVIEAPYAGRKAVRTRLRYQLEKVGNGIATISVDTTVLTPIDDPRLQARLLERIWDGTIRFDIQAGRILSRSTSTDRRVVGFEGPQSSVRYKASLEETLILNSPAN